MKRYCIVIADRGDGIQEPSGYEVPNGQFVSHDDISAHMLKLREVVEGMECNEDCDSRASGWVAGLEVMPGDIDCNCPRGEALRLLGEL